MLCGKTVVTTTTIITIYRYLIIKKLLPQSACSKGGMMVEGSDIEDQFDFELDHAGDEDQYSVG